MRYRVRRLQVVAISNGAADGVENGQGYSILAPGRRGGTTQGLSGAETKASCIGPDPRCSMPADT